MNNKTASIDMKTLLRRMRGEKYIVNEDIAPKKDLTVHDMLKITRKLNEDIGIETDVDQSKPVNKKTDQDQANEEQKFKDTFPTGYDINVDFIELEVTDKYVFWGGTINGLIQFVYKVTPDENTSGVEFNYLEGYNEDDPKNDEIIKRVESYYDKFYEYWIDSVIQKSAEQQ
ncbi:MAG: hypothetical protein WC428_00225 [Candidatus Paceibacterota bacterium]|jgi:hypothetical protein